MRANRTMTVDPLLSRPIVQLLLVACIVLWACAVSSPVLRSEYALAKGGEPPFVAKLRPLLEAKMKELRVP